MEVAILIFIIAINISLITLHIKHLRKRISSLEKDMKVVAGSLSHIEHNRLAATTGIRGISSTIIEDLSAIADKY